MTLNTWNMVPHLNIIERWSDIMKKPSTELLSSQAGSASVSWNMNSPFSSTWECGGPAAQSWSQNHFSPHAFVPRLTYKNKGSADWLSASKMSCCTSEQTFWEIQQNCVNLIWHHTTLNNLGITLITCKGGACTGHKCPESCLRI